MNQLIHRTPSLYCQQLDVVTSGLLHSSNQKKHPHNTRIIFSAPKSGAHLACVFKIGICRDYKDTQPALESRIHYPCNPSKYLLTEEIPCHGTTTNLPEFQEKR